VGYNFQSLSSEAGHCSTVSHSDAASNQIQRLCLTVTDKTLKPPPPHLKGAFLAFRAIIKIYDLYSNREDFNDGGYRMIKGMSQVQSYHRELR